MRSRARTEPRHSSEPSPRSTGGPGTRACRYGATRPDPRSGGEGRRELPTLLIGSHVDSVRNAGRYDGPLGILVALAALERLGGEELPYAIELVAFADEEGLRFKASYLASRAFAGIFDEEELGIVSDDGTRLADAIRAMGGDPEGLQAATAYAAALLGYVEVHIEQGPVLQAEDLPVGIVTAIAGQSRGFVDIVGEAGHAGNTPPHLRHDALCGAAELVLAVEQSMREEPGLIATVGKAEVAPNVGNVIPGLAVLSYDIRHQDDSARDAAVERVRRRAVGNLRPAWSATRLAATAGSWCRPDVAAAARAPHTKRRGGGSEANRDAERCRARRGLPGTAD